MVKYDLKSECSCVSRCLSLEFHIGIRQTRKNGIHYALNFLFIYCLI